MAADTLTVQELTDLRLGTLKTAVDDWKTMAGKLEMLATGGAGDVSASDLEKKAHAADWKGLNATVSREFVTKTAKQFADAAAEAKSILGLLSDAHADFTRHKRALSTAIDELAKQSIFVNGNGNVSSAVPPGAAAGNSKDIHCPTDEELDAAQHRITGILSEATETDRIVARALRALAKNKYDFTEKGPDSVKKADCEQGKADAEYWKKEIAKGHVTDWSEGKLARFNAMLENQRDNPGFTEAFATGLGADGTLQFWRDLAAPPGGAVEGDKAKMLGHVQDNLSMALANASHSDSTAMEQWKKDVIASGTKPFPVDPAMPMGPNGFQVMSSLMHKGRFDADFLDDYGRAMVKYERAYPGDLKVAWRDTSSLDYPPTGRPNDPVQGFMDALGHNPEESLKFFNESTGQGDGRMTDFDYLAGHDKGARQWPADDDGKPLGYGNLGHALESATLGYPYDDQDPHIPPTNTEAQADAREERLDLVSKVMENYESADVIEKQPGIGDSLAKVAAGNIDSLDYSMADWGGSGERGDRDGLFSADKNHLRDFGGPTTQDFLRAIASDQDSYETVSAAQQVYGSSLMAAQDNRDDALDAGLHSVSMHGLMDEARMESIGHQYADDEDARNRALEKQGEWRNFAAGAAIGVGVGVASEVVVPAGAVAAVAVPLGFESVGGAAETAMGTHTIEWLHENEYNNDQQAIDSIEKAQDQGARNAMTPLLNYAGDQHMTPHEVRELAGKAHSAYIAGGDQSDTDDTRGW
ncbi:hypothetical protein OIB37_11945 [Streptomyces sp. NBC_00820]|uniref:hypothetical protein n=1 Tax=Streptomyces sp. NBC_00820 TaxID=2975842 RepID=UPI002ED4604E|nr:hypothetical protein OIB37_11945 [Streptomyces sp. NBC_00820]